MGFTFFFFISIVYAPGKARVYVFGIAVTVQFPHTANPVKAANSSTFFIVFIDFLLYFLQIQQYFPIISVN